MRHRPVIAVLAVLTTVGAWAKLGLYLYPPTPRPEAGVHRAAGSAIARQVLALRAPGGSVSVIARDTSEFPQPALDLLLDQLRRDLGREAVTIDAVREVEVDPLRLVEVPPGDFVELARKAREGGVLVSLLGPPIVPPESLQRLGPRRPKVVAFCPGDIARQIDLRQLFRAGLLDVAIVGRPDAVRRTSSDAAAWFDASFRTVTAANVEGLYEATGGGGGGAPRP